VKEDFTNREIEVLHLVAEGKSNQTIAAQLSISVNTVANHRKNALRKSGCLNMTGLIMKCVSQGIISMRPSENGS